MRGSVLCLSLHLLLTRIVGLDGFFVHDVKKKQHYAFRPLSPTMLTPSVTRSPSKVIARQQSSLIVGRLLSRRLPHDLEQDAEKPQPTINNKVILLFRRIWKSSSKKIGLLVAALWLAMVPVKPAQAKFSYELQESPTYSIRPGMSKTQAELLLEGKLKVEEVEPTSAAETSDGSAASPSAAAPTTTKKQTFSYGDDEDDDDDFLEEEAIIKSSALPTAASQADQAAARKIQGSTAQQFASYTQGTKRSRTLYTKVALCFFVPTYGFMIVREYVRRRREETYVKKGLEILEAQKAEYFNVTAKTADSDVQDALKGLKNKNQTKTDKDKDDEDSDDDDDDDDDDDKEDEPPASRRKPRKPLGPPGKGGGGGKDSGDGGDPGYGKPSDEDLEKLKKLYGKS